MNAQKCDDDDRSPIHWASSKGQKGLVRKFISEGADVNAVDEVKRHKNALN